MIAIKKETERLEQEIRDLEDKLSSRKKLYEEAKKKELQHAFAQFLDEFNIKTIDDLERAAAILRAGTADKKDVQEKPAMEAILPHKHAAEHVEEVVREEFFSDEDEPVEADDENVEDTDINEAETEGASAEETDGDEADDAVYAGDKDDTDSAASDEIKMFDSYTEEEDEPAEADAETETVEADDDTAGADEPAEQSEAREEAPASDEGDDEDFDWKAFDKLW